jgi:ParB family chromosome partitioning protein
VALKHGLGRGLDALLPIGAEEAPGSGEVTIPLDKLAPNPDQPRKKFNQEELRELADSIKEHGVIQPIIAEEAGDGTYIIIAGERRARAAKLAGLHEIPAILRTYTGEKRMEVSLIENIQRENLNPIEEAAAYKRLMDFADLSQEEAAARVGKTRSTVANALRLLKLPLFMQESLEKGALSPGHARAILAVTDKKNAEILYRKILETGLSVRETEKQAAELNGTNEGNEAGRKGGPKPASGAASKSRAPELKAMEEKFITCLGTKVTIDGSLDKGRIYIEYYSMKDLERLYEILS